MTMTLPAATPVPENSASLTPVLRVIVAMVGLIEALSGLNELQTLFGDTSKITTLTLVVIALRPMLGAAAFGFAVANRLRPGIAMLAIFVLARWVDDAPSLLRAGLVLNGDAFVNGHEIFRDIIALMIGVGSLAAAWFNRYLTVATIAVMLPSVIEAAGVAAFAISVIMYGF